MANIQPFILKNNLSNDTFSNTTYDTHHNSVFDILNMLIISMIILFGVLGMQPSLLIIIIKQNDSFFIETI